MGRPVLIMVLACGIAAPAPGTATLHAAVQQVDGRVEVATFGSPALPRISYATTGVNGLVGWVFPVAAGGKPFSLTALGGATGIEDFDIAFYASLGETEPLQSHLSFGDESGTVPVRASWGVITLAAGAAGTFTYTAG